MQMLDAEGKPYTIWGSKNYVMCSSDVRWGNTLSNAIKNVV